ncbi:hypothetical protein ACFWJ5_02485 [Streptomyces qaidamensis]|uniref:hypothetical protein n=1 Tax=Streptomyces qaidamensis TaxID=1783515 RepID=UPI00365AE2B1
MSADDEGITVRVTNSPEHAGVVLNVPLTPEDLARVRAYAAQGHDLEAIGLIEPELFERIQAAILEAVAPANAWGVSDDVQLRALLEGGGS